MNLSESVIPDVDPIKPSFVAELFHRWIGLWWGLVIVGAIVAALSAYVYFSGVMKVDGRIPGASVIVIAIGAVGIYLSY